MVELSVVIPTYNRSGPLRRCLEALERQTQPADDFEVIVVVDGSTDDTLAMLGRYTPPYRLRVEVQRNQGQHIARNLGARIAAGRWCLFLDDDIVAGPGLVEAHLGLHRRQPGMVGIGQILLAVPPDADEFVLHYAEGWKQHYESLNGARRPATWSDCYGGNFSVGRAELLALGGFAPDVRRSHDAELAFRLASAGLTMTYLAEAAGVQVEEKGFRALANDFERAGSAWVTLCRRHPAMLPVLLSGLRPGSRTQAFIRGTLLALRLPPRVLHAAVRLLRPARRRRRWYRFLRQYCYWRGIREQADPDFWRQLRGHASRA